MQVPHKNQSLNFSSSLLQAALTAGMHQGRGSQPLCHCVPLESIICFTYPLSKQETQISCQTNSSFKKYHLFVNLSILGCKKATAVIKQFSRDNLFLCLALIVAIAENVTSLK